MPNPYEELMRSWADDNELLSIQAQILNLELFLYHTYEPSKFGPNFFERAHRWLTNVEEAADQKTLLRLIPRLAYVGPKEFEELFRAAFQGPISRWLVDCEDIDLFADNPAKKILRAAEKTWFCPVSDSFRINEFYHLNDLPPRDLRPDFRSLKRFGDPEKIKLYIQTEKISRIVLLEDFVGSGAQAFTALEFSLSLGVNVLFVPLLICPAGLEKIAALTSKSNDMFRIEPVVRLDSSAFFSPSKENEVLEPLHDLLRKTCGKLLFDTASEVGPYGFPADDPMGALVVMFSNTPDTTLALVHRGTEHWSPIFPRHHRLEETSGN